MAKFSIILWICSVFLKMNTQPYKCVFANEETLLINLNWVCKRENICYSKREKLSEKNYSKVSKVLQTQTSIIVIYFVVTYYV